MQDLSVMLCTKGKWGEFPDEGRYLFEVKLDGIRCLAVVGENPKLVGRSGEDYTGAFPEITEELRRIRHRCILDGELCSSRSWSFQDIAGRVHLRDRLKISLAARVNPATYWVFDLIHLDGQSLEDLPLTERKRRLESLLKEAAPGRIQLVTPSPLGILREAAEEGLIEGLVAKARDSPYRHERSPYWIKFRPRETEDAKIIGYETSDKPDRPFRSLILLGRKGEFQAASGLSQEDLRVCWNLFQSLGVARVVSEAGREKRYFAEPAGEAEIEMAQAPGIPVRFPRVLRVKLDRR
ncbi:MAG: hypothetical protein QW356_02110 [Candidatus Hadarchaeales archaeon]